MRIAYKTAIGAMVAMLAGCGGTTTVVQTQTPPQAVIDGTIPISFDPVARTITLREVSGITYAGAAFSDQAGKTFRQTSPLRRLGLPGEPVLPPFFTVYAIANQPGITAISAVSHQADEATASLILARETTPTMLPSIATATFEGPYQATLSRTRDGRSYVSELLDGELTVLADLNTRTVSGRIANRRPLPNDISPDPVPPSSIRDITFTLPVSLSSASFAGQVSGGELVVGDRTTGQTTGIFGGSDGATLAGHIVMRHTDGSFGPAIERGAYAATRFPGADPFDLPTSEINLSFVD